MVSKNIIHSKKKLIYLICCGIFLGYLCVQGLLFYWKIPLTNEALIDIGVSALCATLSCFVISNTLNFYLPKANNLWKVLGFSVILSFISLLILRLLVRGYATEAYMEFFDDGIPYRLLINFILLTWMAVIIIIWNVQEEAQENSLRKQESERLLREAELFNLRQQLQPHFLFNSLNSIIALIGTKPEEAQNMTFQLSDFLRGTLHKDEHSLIPLQDEIEQMKLYLSIEKVRFGHRLNSVITCEESLFKSTIPAMLIQPLVENAIKHGLYNITGEVLITIECQLLAGMLQIQITNPYDGEAANPKKGTGFGIRSVQRRLFLLFGRQDLLHTEQQQQQFICTLTIPQYD